MKILSEDDQDDQDCQGDPEPASAVRSRFFLHLSVRLRTLVLHTPFLKASRQSHLLPVPAIGGCVHPPAEKPKRTEEKYQ
jgi:hypothetical protein